MLSEHSKHENTLSHMPVKSILEYIDVIVEIHTCGTWVNKKEMNILRALEPFGKPVVCVNSGMFSIKSPGPEFFSVMISWSFLPVLA